MSSYDGNVENVPLTSPGGVVQSGGYMSEAGPDRSPAVGVTANQGRSDSGSGLGGMITSIFKAAFSSG